MGRCSKALASSLEKADIVSVREGCVAYRSPVKLLILHVLRRGCSMKINAEAMGGDRLLFFGEEAG